MPEEREDHSRWAWDTAPINGNQPGPVYIGDKEDWSLEETRRRRDTNRDPWGGVWTQPLSTGATKAKWGKNTFDSGRYRCCDDLHDCGVFVAVKQGPIMAWHFQRQWNFGQNNSKQHNALECKNESMYKGPNKYYNIVVDEIHRTLTREMEFVGKTIATTPLKQKPVRTLNFLEPDVYLRFNDGNWFAIEVVWTSITNRVKHDKLGMRLIEINLNELRMLESDREFNRWIQSGGIMRLLEFEASLEQREKRYAARKKSWDGKDERAWREVFSQEMSRCRKLFGFEIPSKKLEHVKEIEQMEAIYVEEEKRIKQLKKISNAIEHNVQKFGEKLPFRTDAFSSVEQVDEYYQSELGEMLEQLNTMVEAERILEKELLQELNKKYPTFTRWRKVLCKDISKGLKGRKKSGIYNQYRFLRKDLNFLRSSMNFKKHQLKHQLKFQSELNEFIQNLINSGIGPYLPSLNEWDKWDELDKLFEPHTRKSLEMIRINRKDSKAQRNRAKLQRKKVSKKEHLPNQRKKVSKGEHIDKNSYYSKKKKLAIASENIHISTYRANRAKNKLLAHIKKHGEKFHDEDAR